VKGPGTRGWGRAGLAGLSLALLCVSSSAQEAPTLDVVLARAGVYIIGFQRQLSGVVAEEQYVQDVRYPLGTGARYSPLLARHRELKSDLLLVKPVGADRWIQFRDVFEVDGKATRDRSERLMRLFLAPSTSSASQVERIAEESSRYNIGNLYRTVNVPVLALVVLDPANQPRFTFKRTDRHEPLIARGTERAPDAWVIDYQEVQKHTMIRTTNGRDLSARGRFWIEPATGDVLASELVAEDLTIKGTIDVDYGLEPTIGLRVPVSMRERYEIRRDGSRVDGEASYSRYRQFQVKVDEKLAPVVKQ
jgi:hypothetical protein